MKTIRALTLAVTLTALLGLAETADAVVTRLQCVDGGGSVDFSNNLCVGGQFDGETLQRV